VKSRGLKWGLDGLVWKRGFSGVSNIAVDGTFSLRAEAGKFLVVTQGGEAVFGG
jgi:thiamine pyrophosphokinase